MISNIDPTDTAPDLVAQVEEIFSATGVFSQARNFEYRPEQQQMAVAVAKALEGRESLLTEAGTGVGKSFAYLVPAILFAVSRKKKAVICTHTINLQEQLVEKDLPVLKQVLGAAFERRVGQPLGRIVGGGRQDDRYRRHRQDQRPSHAEASARLGLRPTPSRSRRSERETTPPSAIRKGPRKIKLAQGLT